MLISHYKPDGNNSVACCVYVKIRIKHQLYFVTLSFPASLTVQKLCPINADFSEFLLVVLKYLDQAWDPFLNNAASDKLHLQA